ncbi:MAG: prolipoprotein diacylglyceryl transferase [Candidatus Omnitrophica bacterium]|nr:prolipoprotein diacylglyceryl transferase [Candidatus Omnitrophota bacterium]
MHPEICRIGPFVIYSYGLSLALAFTLAITLASRQARRQNFNPELIVNLCFIGFFLGIIGARILYVAGHLSDYLNNPLEIIMFQHGGLSWFGGLILGLFSGVVYLKRKKLPVYKTIDLIIPYVALAQAIGRLGCFLNGCCFGRESSYGIYFPVHKAVLIPTQLYSSLFLVFIFVILIYLRERPHKAGFILFTYLLLYSTKRFFIEFWRADNPAIIFNLTIFQIFAVAIFFLALIKLIQLTKKSSS